jgi:hypothetical protein
MTRLINTRTLELGDFGTPVPGTYAILSHCWGDEEVTFRDWHNPFKLATKKKGYTKIKGACAEALAQGHDYLWCDSNCIDKSSSAELSEAINSMFDWYRNASVCLAYLEDVSVQENCTEQEFRSRFCSSRWFTRGWTLQELLAPEEVHFYSKDWQFLGTRTTLAEDITQATGIARHFLVHEPGPVTLLDTSHVIRDKLDQASVAVRMSWLSRRTTTRLEDMAYCMLGIFDINMPLLYGEGQKAFQRLQEEIIRVSNDMSIFCWHWDDLYVPEGWGSILAPSPYVFKVSGRYTEMLEPDLGETTPYSLTNAGVSIRLRTVPAGKFVLAFLRVSHSDYVGGWTRFVIALLGPHRHAPDVYIRSRLPPLAVPAGSGLSRLAVDRLGHKSMYLPFRQAQLRSSWGREHQFLPDTLRLRKNELDFEGGVLVVLTTSLDAVVNSIAAPQHIMPLKQSKDCTGWVLGVLPILVRRHSLTVWTGFAARHVSLRQGKQTKGWVCTVLGFTRTAETSDDTMILYERRWAQRFTPNSPYIFKGAIPVAGGSLGDREVPVKVGIALGQSVTVNNPCELAVAHINIQHKEQYEPCAICQEDDGQVRK